ncbi:MAG: hypothetical protein AAGF11_23560 [Myxococcota bacterium]
MRALLAMPLLALVLVGGCSEVDIAFLAVGGDDVGGSASSDGSDGSDSGEPDVSLPSCTPARSWVADFSADPTQEDLDGDGMADWVLRSDPGASLDPAELQDGIWLAAPNRELDTQPLYDFSTRTIIQVRMMAASSASVQVWINFDPDADTLASVYLDQPQVPSNRQNVRLYTKPNDPEGERLKNVRGLDHVMIESVVELDPEAGEVSLWVDGRHEGTYSYLRRPIPSHGADLFATVVARDDVGQIDSIRVDACVP